MKKLLITFFSFTLLFAFAVSAAAQQPNIYVFPGTVISNAQGVEIDKKEVVPSITPMQPQHKAVAQQLLQQLDSTKEMANTLPEDHFFFCEINLIDAKGEVLTSQGEITYYLPYPQGTSNADRFYALQVTPEGDYQMLTLFNEQEELSIFADQTIGGCVLWCETSPLVLSSTEVSSSQASEISSEPDTIQSTTSQTNSIQSQSEHQGVLQPQTEDKKFNPAIGLIIGVIVLSSLLTLFYKIRIKRE